MIDEGVGDGMAVIGVEALEQGLGNFLLLEPDLVEEGVGLVAAKRAQVESLEIDPLEVLELLQLIGTNRGLVGPPVGDVEGLVDHVGSEPFLGGRRVAGMTRGDTAVSPMELGVGESCSGNAHGGTGSVAPDGVAGSRSAEAEGGAFRADVPAETGEEFDRFSESEGAHGNQEVIRLETMRLFGWSARHSVSRRETESPWPEKAFWAVIF